VSNVDLLSYTNYFLGNTLFLAVMTHLLRWVFVINCLTSYIMFTETRSFVISKLSEEVELVPT
jgi:hypothetical protein